ncbi:ABC-2 transporter permease [Butyricicoccus sp.]|uniref:ABC-2 transporter permease n=1 Tax=Butyricicoccus sp. TaxID=2049021 RepID=UPI003F160F5B
MKGLIKYDVMQITSALKGGFLLVYLICMAILNVFSDAGNMFSYIIIFIGAMWGISSFSYEETYHWNRYTAALPVSTRQIVLSRYLVIGILIFGGVVASLLLGAIPVIAGTMSLTASEWTFSLIQCVLACILYQEIMIPVMYRFGAERGRVMMLLLFIILFAGVYVLGEFVHFGQRMVTIYRLTVVLGAVAVVCLPISIAVSCRIRASKEF